MGAQDADLTRRTRERARRGARQRRGERRRGRAGPPGPDRAPSTPPCTRSCTSRATRRWPPPATSTTGGPRASRCTRSPACRSRSRTCVATTRPADHGGLAAARGLGAAVRRDAGRAAQGRRHGDPRQDQHGRVRDGLLDRALGVRPDPQPVGPRPHPRRLGRWLGRRGGRVRGAAGDRHRHRRLDPPAGRGHRHGRREADLRRGVALRADRAWPAAWTRPARAPARCWTPRCCTR